MYEQDYNDPLINPIDLVISKSYSKVYFTRVLKFYHLSLQPLSLPECS